MQTRSSNATITHANNRLRQSGVTGIDVLGASERGREWVDGEGILWRWRGGWQWYNPATSRWVESIRPKVVGRGPFLPVS